jgi:hypothetical protein
MIEVEGVGQDVRAKIWEFWFNCMLSRAYPLVSRKFTSNLAAIEQCYDSYRFECYFSVLINHLILSQAIQLLFIDQFSSLCLYQD